MTASTSTAAGRHGRGWVLPLCWLAVVLDGYDLVVLGATLPALLDEPSWGLTPNSASWVSVVGLLGVMAGALAVGPLGDLVGRRRVMVWTVTWFSALTLACAAAPGPVSFAVLRFLAGLGLGGVLPTAIALVTEYAPRGRGASGATALMTGYHVGAVATALVAIVVVQDVGWRWMFVVGALPAVVLVPLLHRRLPESQAFLDTRAARAGAEGRTAQPGRAGVRPAGTGTSRTNPYLALVRDGRARASVAFWVASFMGLLLVYGLNTWLPQIMREAGYDLGAALALLLVLNLGAVLGLLVAGRAADRIGLRRAGVAWFVAAGVFLAVLSVRVPGVAVYASVLLAGIFVFSSQVLVYAFVGHAYPPDARATALGAASGVGRVGAICGPLIGGALLTASIAYPWGFYVFAGVALVGGAAVAAVGPGHERGGRDDGRPGQAGPDVVDLTAQEGRARRG